MRNTHLLGLALITLLAVCGCSGGKGNINGEVKVDKQPLVSGRIHFVCQTGNKNVYSGDITDGKYAITGCPSGPVKVSVESFSETRAIGPGGGQPKDAGMAKDFAGQFKDRSGTARKPSQVIDPKFGNAELSGLEYVVKKGEQSEDFEVSPPRRSP